MDVPKKKMFKPCLIGLDGDEWQRWGINTGKNAPIQDIHSLWFIGINATILRSMINPAAVYNEELSDVVESMSDAFFSIDKDWRLTRVNAQYEKLGGVDRNDRIGKSFKDVLIERGLQGSSYWNEYHKVMKERVSVRFEDYYPRLNMWIECRAYPTTNGGMVVFFSDINDQKNVLSAVELSKKSIELERQNFRNLLKQTPEMMVILEGPEHRFEFVNEAHIKVLGFDATGMTVKEAQPESIEIHGILDEVYRTGETAELNEIPITVTDRLRYFNLTYAARRDELGCVNGVMILGIEISDRKMMEEELAKSRERYQLLFDYSPLPKLIFDVDTLKIIDANQTAVKYYGYSREELLSMTKADLRPPEDLALLKESLIRRHDHTEVEVHTNLRHVKRNGEIRNIEINALDINIHGHPARLCAIVDVTEQKRLLAHLQEAKTEAEKANQLKSAFLANMSHEIRTPLGAILGFTDLLRDPSLSREEHANYINIAMRNGEQLGMIINDILDLSKVEAGHLNLEYSETYPEEVVADVVSLLKVKANEKNLALEYKMDSSAPITLITDNLRLRQILMNIVGNAIKFTQAGSIKVRVYGEDNKLFLEITDTGIGIPTSQQEKIFHAFVQADGTLSRKFGGTGLGLALSRQLARSLGGDVVIKQSREDKGTTFLISLVSQPITATTLVRPPVVDVPVRELNTQALEDIRILVVDDSPDNQQLIWHFLSKYGAAIDFADNGLIGYQKAMEGSFDIVLMDIQMPVMDGYTATQKLRDMGYGKPIIALTAHAMSEVRKKCLNVGCTDHLTKPIKFTELVEAVMKYTGR